MHTTANWLCSICIRDHSLCSSSSSRAQHAWMLFFTHNIDYRRRATPVGISELVKILRQNEHPNIGNENSDEKNDEKHGVSSQGFSTRLSSI